MAAHILCIGAGPVGCSWAAAFLGAGHGVMVWDRDSDARAVAASQIQSALAVLQKAVHGNLEILEDPDAALARADHVQESISETLEAKTELYRAIEPLLCATATVGSSTSAIPGSSFLLGHGFSPRAMVVHPTNPPHIIPMVELCRTVETQDSAVVAVRELLATTGHVVVEVRREIGGYLLNRLQAALVAEALYLVQSGAATPADIDEVVASGLAPRWALGGPFLTGHLNAAGGYLDYMTRFDEVWRDLVKGLHGKADWAQATLEAVDRDVRGRYGNGMIDTLRTRRDKALRSLDDAARKARLELQHAGRSSALDGGGDAA